jgi:hypothetical protein
MIHWVIFIESSGFLSQYFTIHLLRRSPGKKRQLTLGRRGVRGYDPFPSGLLRSP